MIIAIGIIGAVSAITANGLINIMQAQKSISMNAAVAQDAQAIMNLLASEIQNNAIDYEEYYNRKKYGEGFGAVHGEDGGYGNTFFIEKKGTTTEKALECHLGGECYESYLELISPDGLAKTIYGLKRYNQYMNNSAQNINESALAVLKLYSCEIQDGVPKNFTAQKEKCPKLIQPEETIFLELEDPFTGDASLVTSTKANIVSLKFYITPWNDPYKAYAMPEYTYQPSVTIVLTVKPSYYYYGAAADRFAPLTFQTTAVQRFLGEVKTYKPS